MIYICIGLALCLILVSISLFNSKKYIKRIKDSKYIGNLVIDRSDPSDDPLLFLEISKQNIEVIENMNDVLLKVVKKNYISR